MATAGPNSAGTIANDASFGSTAWTNPSNAGASDDSYATVGLFGSSSNYLKCTNFGFAIPNAVINGIQVDIERKATASGAKDTRVFLVKGGTIQSAENKADTLTTYPTSDGTATYGGAADLWSNTWTPTDINNSGFGVALAVFDGGSGTTTSVDNVTITVTYTLGNSLMSVRRHTRFFRQGG